MFLINCDNKNCGKTTQAVLSLEDNNVYCLDCDRPITNVTPFTKTQLKNLKQIKRPKKQAYSVKCQNCTNEDIPKLFNNNLCCKKCGAHLTKIPKSFEILIKNALIEMEKENKEDNKK